MIRFTSLQSYIVYDGRKQWDRWYECRCVCVSVCECVSVCVAFTSADYTYIKCRNDTDNNSNETHNIQQWVIQTHNIQQLEATAHTHEAPYTKDSVGSVVRSTCTAMY